MKCSKDSVRGKARPIATLRFEEQRLTSFAGLIVFQKVFSKLRLKERLRRCFCHLKVTPIYGYHLVVLLLVAHLLLGYRELRDSRYYQDDEMVRRLLGLKRLPRLQELQQQTLTRDQLLIKLGAAKKDAGRAYHLVTIHGPAKDQAVTPETFTFSLKKKKLRIVRQREGHYLLRSNLGREDPATLWQYYLQLTEVEQAFKELKGDLSIRPIYHQKDTRIEAHIFVAFVAYSLSSHAKQRLRALAPGLTPRAVLEKLAALQMVDVHLPTTDGRHLILPRYTPTG